MACFCIWSSRAELRLAPALFHPAYHSWSSAPVRERSQSNDARQRCRPQPSLGCKAGNFPEKHCEHFVARSPTGLRAAAVPMAPLHREKEACRPKTVDQKSVHRCRDNVGQLPYDIWMPNEQGPSTTAADFTEAEPVLAGRGCCSKARGGNFSPQKNLQAPILQERVQGCLLLCSLETDERLTLCGLGFFACNNDRFCCGGLSQIPSKQQKTQCVGDTEKNMDVYVARSKDLVARQLKSCLKTNYSNSEKALVFLLAVKYMREATPYVKKGSPVSEIGWETPPPESPRLGGSSLDTVSSQSFSFLRDQKSIPLKMCFVTRSMALADPENRQLEIHSPDAKHTVILRSKDPASAQAWFSALHSSTSDLLAQVVVEVREQLGSSGMAGSQEIRHLGWLAEKVSGESEKQWKPALVVLTERDLLIYDSMPRQKEAWLSPVHSYPLLATRLVYSGPGKGSPPAVTDLSFATRTGTRQGIEMHLFRAETSRDLSHWTRGIVQGCHHSAELVAEVTAACTYKNQECCLTVHYENGFSITTKPQEGTLPKTIMQAPYEKLKMSSDDGIRMLYLDFGGKDGEIQLDLHSCPKPIVFTIHSFLSAKIARLGLVA
ncbi:beta-1-syntrophin-like [Carlito syrichta]|uniref:Beta-1-syntrophin-like n=1 Tax=Carlito syrichta TaxID=1868482 RepID=A0A3Q0E1N3_CARSF|nr:beta-1-syntrophin-like [Carlito syrichta]